MRAARFQAASPLVILLAVFLGCGSGVSDPGAPLTVGGAWRQPLAYPGAVTHMNLSVRDSTILGTGAFSLETGGSGTMVVTGVAAAARISLDSRGRRA